MLPLVLREALIGRHWSIQLFFTTCRSILHSAFSSRLIGVRRNHPPPRITGCTKLSRNTCSQCLPMSCLHAHKKDVESVQVSSYLVIFDDKSLFSSTFDWISIFDWLFIFKTKKIHLLHNHWHVSSSHNFDCTK